MNQELIQFIEIKEVLKMHDMIIEILGGKSGIHSKELLESALNHPLMIIDYGESHEKTIPYLTATYFYHIIKNHPFCDGNKRTGLLTALKFLQKNNYHILITAQLYDDLYELALNTAASKITKQEIASFFKTIILK